MTDTVLYEKPQSKTSGPRVWSIPPALPADIDRALSKYSPILRQVLYNRGVTNDVQAAAFLRGDYNLPTDPFLLTGMRKAVDRIRQAVEKGEKIAVYGDYDVDGVTASTLMFQLLTALHADVEVYIPNRFDEGYGINSSALEELKGRDITLVVSVDCGIRSVKEALVAKELGIDLIVTDHHLPGHELPEAYSVINPKQPGDLYPDKGLAGVGVAFKLFTAILSEWPDPKPIDEEDVVDLVGLGTVADVVPLKGENRSLVRKGLRQMRLPRRPGLVALINVAGLNTGRISALDIGFKLGPRLNAAGRLESALASFELLSTKDTQRAGLLAQQLDDQNKDRQKLTRDMYKTGETFVSALAELPPIIFVADEGFNPGVVGLVAARLVEGFYRPAIVGHRSDGIIKASCRSIKGFDISAALDSCADLLEKYGGHAAAAGLTLRADQEQAFVERVSAYAMQTLTDEMLIRTSIADAEIPLSGLNMDLVKMLDLVEPTGMENPGPRFVVRGALVLSHRTVGKDAAHLKLSLGDGRCMVDGIGFGLGHLNQELPAIVDVLFSPSLNEYNGNITVQMMIDDIIPSVPVAPAAGNGKRSIRVESEEDF